MLSIWAIVVSIALQSQDLGGGIRIVASYCGCVGLRPTVGRVPQVGVGKVGFDGSSFLEKPISSRMASYGPMGVCVEDLELLLSVIAGPCLDDPQTMVCGPYVNGSSLNVDVSKLRIKGCVMQTSHLFSPTFSQ